MRATEDRHYRDRDKETETEEETETDIDTYTVIETGRDRGRCTYRDITRQR